MVPHIYMCGLSDMTRMALTKVCVHPRCFVCLFVCLFGDLVSILISKLICMSFRISGFVFDFEGVLAAPPPPETSCNVGICVFFEAFLHPVEAILSFGGSSCSIFAPHRSLSFHIVVFGVFLQHFGTPSRPY